MHLNIKNLKRSLEKIFLLCLRIIEFFIIYIINFLYSFYFYFLKIPYQFLKSNLFSQNKKKNKNKYSSIRGEIDNNIIMYSRMLNKKYKQKNKNLKNKNNK